MPELTQAQRDVLTDMELMQYNSAIILEENTKDETVQIQCVDLIAALEFVAIERIKSEARRKMLKKHEWVIEHEDNESKWNSCRECQGFKELGGHEPDCALDALAKEG